MPIVLQTARGCRLSLSTGSLKFEALETECETLCGHWSTLEFNETIKKVGRKLRKVIEENIFR